MYASTSSANIPCSSSSLSDSTAYYSNSYYPPPPPSSSYYFPYGTSSSSSTHYPFIAPFNYPLNNNSNLETTTSYLHMQTSMNISSTDNHHLTPLLPTTTDTEQY